MDLIRIIRELIFVFIEKQTHTYTITHDERIYIVSLKTLYFE